MSSKRIDALFDTVSWDEAPITLPDSSLKMTRVRTTRKFTGALVGHGISEYTMVYHPAPPSPSGAPVPPHAMTATFTGLMHFNGTIGESPSGEAVFVTTGTFDGSADAEWTLDEKTAQGGLKNIKAKGGYSSKGMNATPSWLDVQKSS